MLHLAISIQRPKYVPFSKVVNKLNITPEKEKVLTQDMASLSGSQRYPRGDMGTSLSGLFNG